MLKPLLLSGWFRVQPFVKYAVVAILIAPLVAASGHSTSATQSEVLKSTSESEQSGSATMEMAAVSEPDLAEILNVDQINSLREESNSASGEITAVAEPKLLPADTIEPSAEAANLLKDNSPLSSNVPATDPLAAVELAPSTKFSASKLSLLQKIKNSKIKSIAESKHSLPKEVSVAQSFAATQVAPTLRTSQPKSTTEIQVSEPAEENQAVPADPIGSPHPIPWKWITATQEAIGPQGGGVRYYRSVPVVSPDGKYIVYSRVQLEVKPEMYNSRVTSVLFVEDTQTKKLRVMASTAIVSDPLLQAKASSPQLAETNGKIGVLVPVSWSEKGDRFLARKFEGLFNTADATDRAVIWDRQNNHANTVAPAQEEDEHEKIAVLLGWSKTQPDHVLFRAGELGEENWPLVKVASDGKTVNTTTDGDQPITFGEKLSEVWAEPQVAFR
ncbi:MAG: hypothetical protein KME32_12030 [Mojavia pulchra JT2-VF2]|jgi:hypothetical protein|uniref:Uncharacterized protein n=1 Tax=Mojavia pulchra JT2-VF2 TaxID=287848 RepID=A0A951UG53_9NOST|nr:hypothetical protein [Mojavia pulchra JT2-VF2]